MQRRGTLIEEGDFATLTFQRHYRHRIEHVWDAISTPEGLREWLLCTQATIEGRAGGRIEMVSGPAQYRSSGEILVWDPPRVLEYEWNVAPVPEMPQGERAIFRYELTSEGDTTHLVVTYRRITRRTASGFLPGLHALLDRLEAQLDGLALPDWFARFAELRAEYTEWSGHATGAGD
ncbi:MAG: SRPBCC family protein [Bryobacteraceae bacterium]